jgi:hypothetical protein
LPQPDLPATLPHSQAVRALLRPRSAPPHRGQDHADVGFRLHKRLRGKLSSVLEQVEHGHHVFRCYAKNAVLRMYEKFSTFLRLEALSNNLKDFGLNKGLDNLDAVRRTLAAVTDRFAACEAQALDVHVDFPLFQRLALAIPCGSSKIPGIKIQGHPDDPLDGSASAWAAPRSGAGAPPTFIKPS